MARSWDFTDADIESSGYLTLGGGTAGYVTHNLDRDPVPLVVRKGSGEDYFSADQPVAFPSRNTARVFFASSERPIIGTWRLSVG
jgi:hypothetical protein